MPHDAPACAARAQVADALARSFLEVDGAGIWSGSALGQKLLELRQQQLRRSRPPARHLGRRPAQPPPGGPVLRFTAGEWQAFLGGVRTGEFDRAGQ
jgi:Domain of unknown function (DUF397)